MSLVQRGARNRRTPYYEATQKYGPQGFTVYNHMYFPIRFDSFEAEFDALLNGVTLWDVAVERCLEISGPDGFRFAQLLTPRDLSTCAVGQAKYVLICDGDGGIVNDPVLTRMDENTFWFALASSDALLFARGLKNAYPDLDVTIQEADVAPLQVQGPRSKDLMVKLLGEDILDLRYYFWTDAKIAGVPVVVTRTGWTSEIGYEVYTTDTSRGNDVYEAIMEAGQEFGIKPTGPSDIRRIEGAIFNWGADMTYENNAFEMGLDRLVDLDTVSTEASISIGAYRRSGTKGSTERINGVVLDGDPFPALNAVKWPAIDRRSAGRQGHVGDLLAAPRAEHRLLLAPGGAAAMRVRSVTVETEWGTRARDGCRRCRSSIPRSRSPSPEAPFNASALDPGRDGLASRSSPERCFKEMTGPTGPARSPQGGLSMVNEREEMLAKSATLYFGPWYRQSPFFKSTLRAGCTAYDIYNHMYLPGYYDDPEIEYGLLNEGVTLWDVGVERTVQVSGPDADRLIDMITCRDLTTCAVKQGKYMLVTAPDGGIVNDPVLLHPEPNVWWMQLADSDAGLYALGVAAQSDLDVEVSFPDVHPSRSRGRSRRRRSRSSSARRSTTSSTTGAITSRSQGSRS